MPWTMNVETTTEEAENMKCEKIEIWASEVGGVGMIMFYIQILSI